MENVPARIYKEALDSPSRGKAKVIADISCKAVFFAKAYDQAWPLIVVDWNGVICFHNVSNGGLRTWGESIDDETYSRKCSPGAGEILGADG